MSENLPRKITFEEIKVGDTIRTVFLAAGVHVTHEGVVADLCDAMAFTAERGLLADTFHPNKTITLLDRPVPRMDEPTRIGSVVVVGSQGNRYLAVRVVGGHSSGPWRWQGTRTRMHRRWDELIDPRPATEQEIEEGRAIEP